MKEFFKQVLATVVGIVVVCILLTVLGFVSLAGVIASSSSETRVKDNSIMVLKLETVVERAVDNPLAALGISDEMEAAGLDDILASIKKAAENDDIKGIYIEGSASTSMAPATAEAIRHELLNFKQSKKFIISYADTYSRLSYYIASVADEMLLNPQGIVEWNGMSGQTMYYKDALDKLGINIQVFKVGTYKSAVEPYILNEMSEANREQIQSYMSDIWQQTLKDVSASRKISADSLNAYADRGLLLADANEYLKLKLVDKLVYAEEVSAEIKKLMKLDDDEKYTKLSLEDMVNVKNAPNKYKEGEIAVYYASGEIGSTLSFSAGSEIIDQKTVCKDLRRLRENEDVKAVVFRVNSPGGSAYDSEQIWKEIIELKKEKPVVVSMGDYAASGGYYISCAANYIFAEPTTITGSIGIFGIMPEASNLLENKLGVHFQTVKTNAYSDLGDLSRPMNEAEQALMQKHINAGYELFTKRCADGRKMKQDDIKAIAEGRVWTGNQAIKNGLVDELGGLDKAIEKAKKLAEVEDCCINTYPAQPSFFDQILNKVNGSSYAEAKLKETFGEFYTTFTSLRDLQKKDFIQVRLPYDLKMN